MIQPNPEAAAWLAKHRDDLAGSVTARHEQEAPEFFARFPQGREKCREDARYHLSYMADAVAAGRHELFLDYLAWAKVLLKGLHIGESDLVEHLRLLGDTLGEQAPEPFRESLDACVEAGVAAVPELPDEIPTFLDPTRAHAGLAKRYLDTLLRGDRQEACRLVVEAADAGVDLRDVYLCVFQPVQHEIGRLWQVNEVSVAQEHYCTAATQLIMSQLYPRLFTSERKDKTVVSTCVMGNLHELGARMVADFFEMEGWDSYYLGANTPASSLVSAINEQSAELVAISATLGNQVGELAAMIQTIRADERARGAKIIVGGNPFNRSDELWRDVGADGHAVDALSAVEVATRLVDRGDK